MANLKRSKDKEQRKRGTISNPIESAVNIGSLRKRKTDNKEELTNWQGRMVQNKGNTSESGNSSEIDVNISTVGKTRIEATTNETKQKTT